MADAPLTLYKYRYIPKSVVITVNGNSYLYRDGCVTYFNLINIYRDPSLPMEQQRTQPVIQCGIEMETKYIKEIYENLVDAKLKIDIIEQQLSANNSDEIIGTRLYLQHTFSIIPARDQTVYITQTDTESEALAEEMRKLQNFEIYLIDLDIVNWFKQEYADHYEEVSYAAMLQAMFVARNIPKENIIATPPIQTGMVKDVTVSLGRLVPNIYRLNKLYGLYDCDPIVYHDLRYMYCLSPIDPNIQIENAEDYGTVALVLLNPQKPAYKIPGSCDDAEKQTHWINLNQEPTIFDRTSHETNAQFATLTSVDKKGKVQKTTLDEKSTTMKYIFTNNQLTEAQIMNSMIGDVLVSALALNSSVRFLTPYKDYVFTTDTSYQGLDLDNHIFRLERWTLNIQREGSNTYISEVTLALRRRPEMPDKANTDIASVDNLTANGGNTQQK